MSAVFACTWRLVRAGKGNCESVFCAFGAPAASGERQLCVRCLLLRGGCCERGKPIVSAVCARAVWLLRAGKANCECRVFCEWFPIVSVVIFASGGSNCECGVFCDRGFHCCPVDELLEVRKNFSLVLRFQQAKGIAMFHL